MKVMQIEDLTEEYFFEKEVANITPNFYKGVKGVHTLTKYDEFVSFDYWH